MDNRLIDAYAYYADDGKVTFENEKIIGGNSYHGLLFPSGGAEFKKRIIQAFFVSEVELLQSMSNNKNCDNPLLNENGINLKFVFALKALSRFSGYFINCSSWRDQEMHEYDRAELKERLQKVINLL